MTAFLEAADRGSLPVLKLLHAHKADVHKQSSSDDGALELAKWGRDSEEITAWLKSVGVQARQPEEEEEHHHDDHDYHD